MKSVWDAAAKCLDASTDENLAEFKKLCRPAEIIVLMRYYAESVVSETNKEAGNKLLNEVREQECPTADAPAMRSEKIAGLFKFAAPKWVNGEAATTSEESLKRAEDIASAYYPLGCQTGIHSMIEWCGVMGEYVKMLRHGYEHGIDPCEVDQHHEDCKVEVPPYMVEYFTEKLGCQLKPFIRANPQMWREQIDEWFEGA